MYIPQFVCGVVATIMAEIAIVIAAAVIVCIKDKKRRKNKMPRR